MGFNKPRIELISFVWILLLYQTPDTLCAPLQNHSLKFSSDIHRNSNILNLSDLIEFSPLNLPKMKDNVSAHHQEVSVETTPEIMTFKLKTHLIIHNKDSDKQRTNGTNEEIKMLAPNESKSSLSDIEYVDPSDDFEFWRWTANKRTRKLNYVDEKSSVDTNKTENKNSSEEVSSKILEMLYDSDDSEENKISEEVNRSKYATGRQFVFHPYLPYVSPYGKHTNPDEKISFDDILPVKMVKFIKSMVEEAPWEQMFMKMVRMIVDQFVDKIIEKMFADKDQDKDHFKKRSFEVVLSPTFVLPTFKTPVIRLKRSVASETSNDQDDDIFNFLPPKRDEQDLDGEEEKNADEKKSWLDHLLDYLFPNSKSEMEEENPFDRLKKRDTTNTHFFKTLLTFFLSTFEKSSGILSDAKDVLRYKMLKEFLPYLYQKKYMNNDFDSFSNSVDRMRMTHRKSPDNVIKRKDASENLPSTPRRSKRSTRDDFRKDDEERLWQAHSRRQRPPNHHRSHDQCSLRKACNAGRLLSRIPSVQEITLQLR